MIANIIIGAVLALIVGAAIWYIWKAHKSGKKCIGCSSGGMCSSCKGCDSTANKTDK